MRKWHVRGPRFFSRVAERLPVLNLDQLTRYKALAGGAANLVVESAYSYDTAHRLTGMVNTPAAGNGSTWGWQFNTLNQVTQFTNNGVTTYYGYDAAGQLINADASQTPEYQTYTWDLNGNRRNYQDVGGANNQLTETATHTYAYDDEGNRSRTTLKST
jgi:YD repeat-containing protein